MFSFDENGWLFPEPLKNITHDIDSAEIDDLLKLAKEEDYWSAGIRETVISMPFGKDIITFNSNRHFFIKNFNASHKTNPGEIFPGIIINSVP